MSAAIRVGKFLQERRRMGSLDQVEVASLNVGNRDREAVLRVDDLNHLVGFNITAVDLLKAYLDAEHTYGNLTAKQLRRGEGTDLLLTIGNLRDALRRLLLEEV